MIIITIPVQSQPQTTTCISVDYLLFLFMHTYACGHIAQNLCKSNAFNLNGNTLGQLLGRDTRTSRLVGEKLLILRIHLGEVRHVIEEDIDTDDLANGRSGGIEDGLDVVTASLGLGCDVTLDKAAVLVRGDLAREENLAICLDGLRVGAHGRASVGSEDVSEVGHSGCLYRQLTTKDKPRVNWGC